MKSARTFLTLLTVMALCWGASATETAFMAYDTEMGIMRTYVAGGAEMTVCVVYEQSDGRGFIDSLCQTLETVSDSGVYAFMSEIPLSPADETRWDTIPSGVPNTITAHISIMSGGVQTNSFDVSDELLSDIDPVTSTPIYVYQDPCTPILPDTIRISSATCAYICHGSYQIPIFCEDPGYTPAKLEVTVTNGCDPAEGSECDSVSCAHINPDVFSWYKRVRTGCRLYLVMTYCDSWPGCVCIVRSDFYLPVEMVGFEAAAGDGHVLLSWATASETNTGRFMITRAESPDGMYAPVHYEAAQGNSSTRRDYSWVDRSVENGRTYYYKLHIQDLDGSYHYYNRDGNAVIASATPSSGAGLPIEFALNQNYPNPFNSLTTFSFSIPAAGHVTLKVYDVLGREVATVVNENLAADHYTFNWSADGLPTGVYVYTLKSGAYTATKKLLFLK